MYGEDGGRRALRGEVRLGGVWYGLDGCVGVRDCWAMRGGLCGGVGRGGWGGVGGSCEGCAVVARVRGRW